jgi:hypothetical protein
MGCQSTLSVNCPGEGTACLKGLEVSLQYSSENLVIETDYSAVMELLMMKALAHLHCWEGIQTEKAS